MKKIRPFATGLLFSGALFLGSCTLTHTVVVTNNPVGSKTGQVRGADVDVDSGVTYSGAMKAGGITKAGIAEYKYVNYLIFNREYMTVTGE